MFCFLQYQKNDSSLTPEVSIVNIEGSACVQLMAENVKKGIFQNKSSKSRISEESDFTRILELVKNWSKQNMAITRAVTLV